MSKESTRRSLYLDNLSGVLICFTVLFYHLPGYCGLDDTSFFKCFRSIFGFFMAWFFFKSGMFAAKRSVKEELIRCWHRLIKPFIIINAFCFVINLLLNERDSILEILKVSVYRECSPLCFPLWFCLSLAIIRVGYQVIAKIPNIWKGLIMCLSVSLAFVMYLYSYKFGDLKATNSIGIPFWFGNVFLGLFFYILGDLLRDFQFNKWLFIVALLVYIISLFLPSYLDFYINQSDHYFLSVFYYISGIIVFNNLFKRWLNKRAPLLTHIGQFSMIYYITHGTFLYLLFVGHLYRINGWIEYIVSFFLTILFLICMDCLIRKKMRWLIGQ